MSANSRDGCEMATLISRALVSLGDQKHFLCRVILFINVMHLFMSDGLPVKLTVSSAQRKFIPHNFEGKATCAWVGVVCWALPLDSAQGIFFSSVTFYCIRFYFTLT